MPRTYLLEGFNVRDVEILRRTRPHGSQATDFRFNGSVTRSVPVSFPAVGDQ